jgi:superfamily II DNA or RNA helicase
MNSKIDNSGFKFRWKPTNANIAKKDGKFYGMRRWQEEAFDVLKEKSHMILNAPTGSGKSWLMCSLSAYKMKKNKKLRCIISVPQTIIANGFVEANMLMPDGGKIEWMAENDLCSQKTDEGTIKKVLQWLVDPYVTLSQRILLCSHATLVAAYKKIKENKSFDLLENLLLWVDEAHHLKSGVVEGFDNSVMSNGIGELVNFACGRPNIEIGLATATLFRGDRMSLLAPKIESKFTRYNLPYDKYLESMNHLRSFSFDFALCGPNYCEAIGKLVKDKKKDVIHIPSVNSRHSTGDKHKEVSAIIEKYKKIHGNKVIESDDGLTSLVKKDNVFKICDLVDEDLRDEKKDYINNIKGNKDALDAVIALGMFKEGANWIWAERSIIVGARASLVDVVQIIGRLFRDAEGKENVSVIQLLPFSLDQKNEEEFEFNLNNYLKAIFASLILENILRPVQIKSLGGVEKNGDKKESVVRCDYLSNYLPDDAKQVSLMEDVFKSLLRLQRDSNDVMDLWDEYQEIIPVILKKYGIVDNVVEVSKQIWGMLAKQTLRMEGIDVEGIDFDILQKTSPLDCILMYTSGACGIDTFQKLRDVLNKRNNKLDLLSKENFQKHFINLREEKGEDIQNGADYQLYRANDCDYNAVLLSRANKEKK